MDIRHHNIYNFSVHRMDKHHFFVCLNDTECSKRIFHTFGELRDLMLDWLEGERVAIFGTEQR